MTVEEQMLMNTLSKECERLHKELQVAEKHIDYLKEDKNQLYARCDKTARDDFLKGMYGSIRITSISEFVRLHKELQKKEDEQIRKIDADELIRRITEKAKRPSIRENLDICNGLCGAVHIIYDMLIESGQEKGEEE